MSGLKGYNGPKLRDSQRATGPNSGGIDGIGVLDSRILPDPEFSGLWDSIILDKELKDRLLSQAILNFTLRPKISQSVLPLHGVILLKGPPGTGKTTLAKGLASSTAESMKGNQSFRYIEVELPNAEFFHGRQNLIRGQTEINEGAQDHVPRNATEAIEPGHAHVRPSCS